MKFEIGDKVITSEGMKGQVIQTINQQYVLVALENGVKKATKVTELSIDDSFIVPYKTPLSTSVSSQSILSEGSLNEVSSKIYKKPSLITKSELLGLGKDIKLVNYNQLLELSTLSKKSFSLKLINWVEPYDISGMTKTLFYTEYNTNLQVGDRVFIIGGNYDSNELISIDKYKKGRDGYKVLYIENCKVALDIDYTGVLPYEDESVDNFINVFYVKSFQEFQHVNRQVTTRAGIFDYKFNYYQNNIAYVDQDYVTTKNWGLNGGITSSPGFFVRNGITQSWTNITNEFMNSGSYSVALSPTYPNVDRIKIFNGDFTYGGKLFKEGYVYKWFTGPTQSEWVVDVRYFSPIISKANFRNGNFDGIWNTGLFGTHNKKIVWEGDKSTWNAGTLLNTTWKQGKFNSKFTLVESYISGIDENGLPFEKLNRPNNNGRSFNFIYDSNIESSTIVNGNIIGSTIGTSSATFSVVEEYLLNLNTPFPVTIEKAFFENCSLSDSVVNNSELKNIRSNNSVLKNVKSINSYFKDSVFLNSNFNSENIIKVLGYDELNANEYPGLNSTYNVGGSFQFDPTIAPAKESSQKVYKFYISEAAYYRLKLGDEFYIKGLKLNNNSKDVLNIFDRKFRIGTWTEYFDDYDMFSNSFYKRPVDISAFLSTPAENSYLFESVKQGPPDFYYTSVYKENQTKLYSIDIWISLFDLNEQNSGYAITYLPELKDYFDINTISPNNIYPAVYDYISVTGSGPISLSNIVDVSTAYIVDSDFNSGIFEKSNWNGGNHMNSQNDLNITVPGSIGGSYSLSFTQSKSLLAISNYDGVSFPENGYTLTPGQVVFLDAVDFNDGSNTYRLPDAYKVSYSNNGQYVLEEIETTGTSQIISLSASTGTFSTVNSNNRYGYLKSTKFKNSKIKSGIFRRPYISESLIENDNYNSLDLDYQNLQKVRNLVVTDLISSNKSNYLSSATYLYSTFAEGNDIWNDGIIQNSVWNSGTFSSGTIKESTWIDGTFNGGYFYNSRSFNGNSSSDYQFYDSDRIKTWWKSGLTDGSPYISPTIATTSNNRFSWRNGRFLKGDFYKSDWENGTFSDGKFYISKWYNGTFENGLIGTIQSPSQDTEFYNGIIKFATVENASINSKDTSYLNAIGSSVLWENGIFNNGVFRVEVGQNAQNYATWSTGRFNDGEFTTMAKWKNGTFNGGKFTSYFGWTQSDSFTQSDYGWENGIFNGGEFGNANGLTNSTWYQGEFNDGLFKGRVWNYGIFLWGEFQGSGGNPVGGTTCSNSSDFVDSYTNSFWGEWRNGIVTDTKDKLIKEEKSYYTPKKANIIVQKKLPAKLKNILWKNGTFSHPNAGIESSVWLDGAFEKGRFIGGSFNPYVKRNGQTFSTFNLDDETCYWENGYFNNGDFYISRWKQGLFDIGTATGMIWENGVTNYMNAYNVFWENGLWKNGNWNGSTWNFNYEVSDDYVKQILFRGMTWSGTSSCHVWNVFLDNTFVSNSLSVDADTPIIIYGDSFGNLTPVGLDTFDPVSPGT